MVSQRDRSSELYALFEQQKVAAPSFSTSSNSAKKPLYGLHSSIEVRTFVHYAQAFSKNVAKVSESIGRLTKLTLHQNVFDDQTKEISGLTQMVKSSLQQLHSDLETLENLKERAVASQKMAVRQNAPTRDNRSGDAMKASQKHSDAVVDTLKSRLARTGQVFRSALQTQTRNIKTNATRRHMFTSADRPQTFESALFQDQEQHQLQEQQLVAGMGNTQYFRQRAEAVTEIEAAVAEVSELFSDFTRLVHEQDEVVVRIDTDVDEALRNVNAGSNELMRYLVNLSSNRGLILKILGLLFFFLLFFGMIVVR